MAPPGRRLSDSLTGLDAGRMAALVAAREVSPVELVKAHLSRIEEVNPTLNAVVALAEDALENARRAEQALTCGEHLGPLHGVPFTIKDSIDVAGFPTTSGSLLTHRRRAERDAPVVARLRDAGGILLGKTNTPEFTLWWETDNRVFGRTNNPWDIDRTPGGSSGGEAAAISSGMSPLGIGSDSGGSIRVPASYCNLFGMKPTHGRVPMTGHVPSTLLAHTHVGPMARSAGDIALAMSVIEGPDGRDHYAVPAPPTDPGDLERAPGDLRVGFYAEGPVSPVSAEVQSVVREAASVMEDLGCRVEEVELPFMRDTQTLGVSGAIASAEGFRDLGPLITGREDDLAISMKRRMALPRPTGEQYLEALASRDALRAGFMEFFRQFDVLLCPPAAVPAPPHDSAELSVDGRVEPGRTALMCTAIYDLTGSPAISAPFGFSSGGLPIGVQIVGPRFEDGRVIHVAARLSAAADAANRRPPVGRAC